MQEKLKNPTQIENSLPKPDLTQAGTIEMTPDFTMVTHDIAVDDKKVGDITLDYSEADKTASVNIVVLDEASNRGKGIGKNVYRQVPGLPLPDGRTLKEAGYKFVSSPADRLSESGTALWQSFAKSGEAIKRDDGSYEYVGHKDEAEIERPDPVITPTEAAEFNLDYNNKIRGNTELPIEKRRAAQARAAEMADVLEILDYSASSGNSIDSLVMATERGIGNIDLVKLKKAQEFAGQDYDYLHECTPYKLWERDSQAKATEKAETQRAAAAQEEVEQKATTIDASRAELAEAYFIDEVLKGGVAVSTDFAAEYSPNNGSGGFRVSTEAKRQGAPLGEFNEPFVLDDRNLNKTYGDKGIYEGVVFSPVSKNVYEEVEVPGRKKMFGREPATKEHRITGTQPMLASEVVAGATDEPAVEMTYRTFGDTSYSQETEYKVSDGRTGNYLVVSVVMPQSVAAKLEQDAKADPKIIRTVAEKAMLENTGIPEAAWRTGDEHTRGRPMRPPYERWAKASGGQSKMYFQEPGSKTFDPSRAVAVKS